MKGNVAEAALQYSKKLSKWITWFWIVYRFLFVGVSALVPEVSSSIASTLGGIDTIMMINVGTYLVNSLGEKYIYSDRFVLSWIKTGGWKALATKITNTVNECSEEEGGEG